MRTAELRKICQKGEGELFLISAYVYRPFTIYISRFCLSLGLRGNTITFLSLLAGLVAAALVLGWAPFNLLGAAICLQVYFIADHVDGEVVRFDLHRGRQQPSLAGEFFDFWTHFHTVNLIFATMGLGLFLQTGQLLWAILGVVACNISSNLQRMPLANVVLGGVARGQIKLDDPKLEPILDICCGFSQRKRFAQKMPPGKTAYLFLSEFSGYPGNLLALTLVFVADGCLSIVHPGTHLFRCVFLALYCVYGVLSKAARTIVSIRQLKEVPVQR